MNIDKFKSMLIKNGSSYNRLAKKLGLTKATIYRKTQKNQFYISELQEIKKIFDLSDNDFLNIFFN